MPALSRAPTATCPGSAIASIGLSSFAAPNLTKPGRCPTVISTNRWLYSTGGPDRYGFDRGPHARTAAGRWYHGGAAQRPLRRRGLPRPRGLDRGRVLPSTEGLL